MPRTGRASTGGICCHVLNRGNGQAQVFHKHEDYSAFVELIGLACRRTPMRVMAWCLMPNHFHLVVRPHQDGELAQWMQWLMTSHVRRHHRRYGTSGHVWQGRFKSFPLQQRRPTAAERARGVVEAADPFWTVVRYVERNALRGSLVARAQDWPWSSLRWWTHRQEAGEWMKPQWLWRPADWLATVNQPQMEAELTAVRQSIARGRPFGSQRWVRQVAARLALQHTLRPRGRPRERAKK